MTIDKAIAKIWHCIVSIRDCEGNKEFVEALELSVNTMHKYQKIKRIIKAVDDRDIGYSTMMDALHKVVDDENND